MTDVSTQIAMTMPAKPGRRGFMLGQKLRQAATRLHQVLSQEKDTMSSDDDLAEEVAALGLALELSVAQQLHEGYVLDPTVGTDVNPAYAVQEEEEDEEVARVLREEARLLREAQDVEFARALEQDQRRERSLQQREAWRRLRRNMQKQRLRYLQARIVPEPQQPQPQQTSTATSETTSLVLRFPDGRRVERRFWAADRLADVRLYVEALALEEQLKQSKHSSSADSEDSQRELSADDEIEELMADGFDDDGGDEDGKSEQQRFELVSAFPRRRLEASDNRTLAEAGLCPTGVLFLQPVAASASADVI